MTKTCTKCERTLPISEFSLKRDSRTGNTYRLSHCRECNNAYRREWRAKNGATQGEEPCLYEAGELRWMDDPTLLEQCPRWLLIEATGYGHSTVSLIKNNPWDNGKVEFSDVWNDVTIKRVREYLERLDAMGVGRITRCKATTLKGEAIEGKEAARQSGPKTVAMQV